MIPWLAVAALGSLSACLVSKDSLGSEGAAGDEDDGGPMLDVGGGSTSIDDGMTGSAPSATTDEPTTDEPFGESGLLDFGGIGAACASIDHDTCFPAVHEACEGQGSWNIDDDCVATLVECYPMGTEVITPGTIADYCHAELEEGCLDGNGPGCGQTFCECTIGAYPFDWENCWHVLLLACAPGTTEDCAGALSGCYPDATQDEYQACRAEIIAGNNDCDCPMCGGALGCQTSLTECLGG